MSIPSVIPTLSLPTEAQTRESKARALVFEDPASVELLRRLEQLAPSDATVLISGETGTGKEIVARHLHHLSQRAARPFVAVNCGAFTETLVDAELFGHERGAFTGASTAKAGWFEAANGGTLFLDEIGDLPPPVQVKLLRVLQEREVVRLGSRQAVPIDVRLVAATNVDLREAVESGRFRKDLFYRLNVASVRLAPLRERPGDILRLAGLFLSQHRQAQGGVEFRLTPEATEALLAHPWPGNIRELENVVHHAVLVSPGGEIRESDLGLQAAHLAAGPPPVDTLPLERALLELYERNLPDMFALVEEALIRSAYEYCHRNQLQTARLLGVSRNIVRARLLLYGALPEGSPRRPATGADL